MKSLADLKVGEVCTVEKISTCGTMSRRFIDIGLIEGTIVECVGMSPSKDPKAYLIRGAVIAIRSEDCTGIKIKILADNSVPNRTE